MHRSSRSFLPSFSPLGAAIYDICNIFGFLDPLPPCQYAWKVIVNSHKMCLKSPGTDVGAAGFERVSQDF